MAAAKMKNVQAPALMGWNNDSQQHHAADVREGPRILDEEKPEIEDEEDRGAEKSSSHTSGWHELTTGSMKKKPR